MHTLPQQHFVNAVTNGLLTNSRPLTEFESFLRYWTRWKTLQVN